MDLITPGYDFLFWQLLGLTYFAFWVYALYDCVRNDFRDPNQKLIWVILILFAPVIGTFLYLSMNRKTKGRKKFRPDFNKRIEN